MKRLLVAFACAVTLLPAGAASASQAAPPWSCAESPGETQDGIESFTAELDRAGAAATIGDRFGADRSVHQSGTILLETAGRLRKHAETAQNPDVRKALEAVARELETTGSGLTGTESVQDLDTKRLEVLANRVSKICTK